jgi:methylase of polypeptide subunit release factors
VVAFESNLALHGGVDGLNVVRDIVRLTPPLLASSYRNYCSPQQGLSQLADGMLWMEVSHTHPQQIEELVRVQNAQCGGAPGNKTSYFEFVDGLRDLYGQPRFVKLVVVAGEDEM